MDHLEEQIQAQEKKASSKQKRYVYGLVTFAPGITKKQICNIIGEDRIKLLRDKQINIFSAFRERIDFFEHMSSCRFTTIVSRDSIISQRELIMLTTVKYERLRNLDLCENQITNIESLVALDAPFLDRLMLYHNHISNVSNFLSKLTFKRLQLIQLSNNPILRINMGRCKASFRPSETTEVYLRELILLDQGISILAKTDDRHGERLVREVKMKMETQFYYQIWKKYVVVQRRVLRSLQQKYSNQ